MVDDAEKTTCCCEACKKITGFAEDDVELDSHKFISPYALEAGIVDSR